MTKPRETKTVSRSTVRFAPLLLFAWIAAGCVSAETILRERSEEAEAQALKTLHDEYRLPEPPPFDLAVRKTGSSATATFHLTVDEPGWEAETPFETAVVTTTAGPDSTEITWELPSERVTERLDDRGYPLLLHLWRGPDHRHVILPCKETRFSFVELAAIAVGGSLAIVTVCVWLPSYLILTPLMRSSEASKLDKNGYVPPPQPGDDAPDCYPWNPTLLAARVDTDPSGRRVLVLSMNVGTWRFSDGTALESVRRAIGRFQPDLAEGVAEGPSDTFLVRLPEGELGKARPLFLLLRDGGAGSLDGELFALYFSSTGERVKAWRLYQSTRTVVRITPTGLHEDR
jgi:hypothetical protein